MRYEHTPRPEVEQHHHIRELIETQDRRAADRDLHRAHEAARGERAGDAAKLGMLETMAFYCGPCGDDFMSETVKQQVPNWEAPAESDVLYRAKCPKGHWALRLGLDRHKDPYFQRSRLVARQRGEYAKDILQPWDSGYDMLYRNKNQHRK